MPKHRSQHRVNAVKRGGLDSTFLDFVQGLAPELREVATGLPFRLGLIPNEDGGWQDVVVLEPNRDLPAFAAEDAEDPAVFLVSEERLARFRAAHHLAVIYGVVSERMSARRGRDARLMALRRALRRGWEAALAHATGTRKPDRSFARACIAQALLARRRGATLERQAFSRGTLSAPTYAEMTRAKLRWSSATSEALLVWLGQPRRAALLRQAHERFSLAIKYMDDAMGSYDEEAGRSSVPSLLRLPPGGLFCAAPRLSRQAAELATRGGFPRFATWLTGFSHTVDAATPGNLPQNEMAGLVLWAAAEGN